MPRLVRQAPLADRIRAYLNPYDFLLWLSEELHESAWDDILKDFILPIGVGANLVFVVARANGGQRGATRSDDVFGDFDGRGESGWFAWIASFTAHLLMLLSFVNTFYTFTRTRHYRLFESSIDQAPSTPSAYRVRVDSSPASRSPLRYLASKLAAATAASRAHPDRSRDVWELQVWDPKEFNLQFFTLFSPGHVLIYWLFLPTASLDPRPSVTVVTSILIAALLALQLGALCRFFDQQAKDARIINKEVLNEYDTKFVHPNLIKPLRDVGTQTYGKGSDTRSKTREVDVYTPTTIINRGFNINPNPNYTGHLSDDPDILKSTPPMQRLPRSSTFSLLRTPLGNGSRGLGPSSSGTQAQTDRTADLTSPFKHPQSTQPQHSSLYQNKSPQKGDGGSLGVYSHAASPLKKAASAIHLRPESRDGQYGVRTSSPLKRMSAVGTSDARESCATADRGDRLVHRFGNLRERDKLRK